MAREDSLPAPPKQRFGTPRQEFPTPNIEDWVIVHEDGVRLEQYQDGIVGTPNPDFPTALLTNQETMSNDGRVVAFRRTYASPRQAQEAYNAVLQYMEEVSAYPIYIRSFLMTQADYYNSTRPARGTPCSAVIRLKITAGGAGYVAPTISIAAGSGVQAAGVVQQVGGVIVAAGLTVSGTGYATAPSVTISDTGGGSGAAITAFVQPQTTVLVSEKMEGIEDEALAPTWVRIIQVYKTEPGPVLNTKTYTELGEPLTIAKFEDLISSHGSAPALTLNVLEASVTPKDGVVAEIETKTRSAPAILNDRLFNHELANGAKTTVTTTEVVPGSGDDALPNISATGATLDARIEHIAENRSRTVITARDEAQPVLSEWEVDPHTQVPILTQKQWVNGPGVVTPDVSATPTSYGGTQSIITAITVATATNITTSTAHGISNGNTVYLQGLVAAQDVNLQIPIDGFYVATVVDSLNFTVPVHVTVVDDPSTLLAPAITGTVTICTAGTYLGIRAALFNAGGKKQDVLEFKSYDKWRTVQIVTKMPSLYGGDQTRRYRASVTHVWPDVLNVSVNYLSSPPSNCFNWSFAANGSNSREDFEIGLLLDIKEGYRGESLAFIQETVTLRPQQLALYTVKRWHPHTFDVPANWTIVGTGNGQATARAVTFRIPNVVVPGSGGSGGFVLGYAQSVGNPSGSHTTQGSNLILPWTDADEPVDGTFYPVSISTEPWRFGAWISRTTWAQFPP